MKFKINDRIGQVVGVIMTLALLVIFIANPSFPTPDKLIVFLFFFFMIFKQALFMLKRLLPFVVILLVYDSFRGIADELNSNVNYGFAPAADKLIFGGLPTIHLQDWLWHGSVAWYDFVLYLPYMLHFVLPLGLAVLIWKTKEAYYWRFVAAFSAVSFMAFFTFLLFPAAPPWLASDIGHIEPLTRISSEVWSSLGIEDFPSFYNEISPNPVAAVPSLHAAWAALVFIYVYKFFGRRWGAVAVVYPAIIFFGTIYQGEHFAFDVLVGIVYAAVAYLLAPMLVELSTKAVYRLKVELKKSAPVVPKTLANKKNNHKKPNK